MGIKAKQIIAALIAITIGIALYFAPKALVKKESAETQRQKQQQTATPSATPISDTAKNSTTAEEHVDEAGGQHQAPLSNEEKATIAKLKLKVASASVAVKNLQSISALYLKRGKFDSSAFYTGKVATLAPSVKTIEAAADRYLDAAGFTLKPKVRAEYTKTAQAYLEDVLQKDPKNQDAKVKLGTTYVDSENPMKGISMLLEVVRQNPDNKLANLNLGMLAIRSNQYDKALIRFEKLVALDSENSQALFYLATCQKETGQIAKAKATLTLLKQKDKTAEVQAAVAQMLSGLK